MAEEGIASGAGHGATKKLGPLPVWGWVIVAAVGAYSVYRFILHPSSSSSAAQQTPTYSPTAGSDPLAALAQELATLGAGQGLQPPGAAVAVAPAQPQTPVTTVPPGAPPLTTAPMQFISYGTKPPVNVNSPPGWGLFNGPGNQWYQVPTGPGGVINLDQLAKDYPQIFGTAGLAGATGGGSPVVTGGQPPNPGYPTPWSTSQPQQIVATPDHAVTPTAVGQGGH